MSARRSGEAGSILIEMLLALLALALLAFGAFEFARAVSIKQALDVGTYNAARHLSLAPDDWAMAENLIRVEIQHSVLGQDYADAFSWTPHVGDGRFGTLLTVEAHVDFAFDVPLMTLGSVQLEAQHSQPIERYP
ncbi:MAG: pilus assembly protein [Chloroflexi bacterium]|nr:pilus assembly protein [Chloroflexota bacterium]MBU1747855.1 pilus assembly protein [Chloroflexota bacterium]